MRSLIVCAFHAIDFSRERVASFECLDPLAVLGFAAVLSPSLPHPFPRRRAARHPFSSFPFFSPSPRPGAPSSYRIVQLARVLGELKKAGEEERERENEKGRGACLNFRFSSSQREVGGIKEEKRALVLYLLRPRIALSDNLRYRAWLIGDGRIKQEIKRERARDLFLLFRKKKGRVDFFHQKVEEQEKTENASKRNSPSLSRRQRDRESL